LRRSWLAFLLFSACSSTPPAPAPEILPCYKAKTFKEFVRLDRERAKAPNRPLVVRGRKYACVESALGTELSCYVAKTRKEFDKLSVRQQKTPAWPIRIGKKYYRCIQLKR
jgi:hypothetical protein